jgi:hypothetical protein
MLIGAIDGQPAGAHPAAHVFAAEGFACTAMGLQARVAGGIAIAAPPPGGASMAEPRKDNNRPDEPRPDETRETEHDRIRQTNDRDQRAGDDAPHNRGYDEAVRGEGRRDIDPDSAESDVDRDDTITD